MRHAPRHTFKLCRADVMSDAHKRFRYARQRGWHDVTFASQLRLAWAAARQRRAEVEAYHRTLRAKRPDRGFAIAA